MKNYGECTLIDEKTNWSDEAKVIVKYHNAFIRIGGELKYLTVGKDIITGTKIYKEDYEKAQYLNTSLSNAASSGHLKKGKLIMVSCFPLSRQEVLERLRSMTPEDLQEHTNRINNMKARYEEARRRVRAEKIDDMISEAKTIRSLLLEKGRVRRLARRAK